MGHSRQSDDHPTYVRYYMPERRCFADGWFTDIMETIAHKRGYDIGRTQAFKYLCRGRKLDLLADDGEIVDGLERAAAEIEGLR